jgi:NADH-quinone oxidoreductase subunit K
MNINFMIIVGSIIFLIGILGVLLRRNLIIILMSIELMLNGVNLNFIAFANYLGDVKGQIFALFVIAVAVAEATVAFGLIIAFMRNKDTFNIDDMTLMKG